MQNENMQLASINRDKDLPFSSSGFNTFTEAKPYASGDNQNFSAAFASNEDNLRYEN